MSPWIKLQFTLVKIFIVVWITIGVAKCIPDIAKCLPVDILNLFTGLTYSFLALVGFKELGEAISNSTAKISTVEEKIEKGEDDK